MRAEPTSTRRVLVQERGIALIAALMIMLLMSALMIGFTAVVMSDQRYRGIDKDRLRAYYGAQSGLEKLTTDFGELYFTDLAVPNSKVALLGNNPPVIPGITFVAPSGVTAYAVTPTNIPCPPNPVPQPVCAASIGTGPYNGLIALKKLYSLDSVARTAAGGEAHLMRQIETVAIPVFQFGTFSDVDLSLFAGGTFTFGGRIHTNGNLFLTAQDGGTTTVTDKVTAVGDVIRQRMQNGLTLSVANFDGTIKLATAPNTYRSLLATEGSLVDGVGSTPNTGWQPISIGTYNGNVRNGGCPPLTGCPVPPAPPRGTGAKPLNLALISPIVGGTNTDLSRRPPVNEDVNNSVLFGERLFGKVAVRILLSDTAADITSLPTVTATAPIPLGEVLGVAPDWKTATPAGITAVDVTHPPIARAPGGTQGLNGSVIAGLTTGVAQTNGQNYVTWAGALPTAASPYQLHSPNLVTTISKAGNVTEYMTCTIVTATQLQGCIPTNNLGLPVGMLWTLMAASSQASVTVNGVTYNQTLVENISAGGNSAKTFTITGGIQPYTATAPWGWNTFWVPASDHPAFTGGNAAFASYPTLVSCTGFTTVGSNRFTGCTGTSSVAGSVTGVPAIALNAPISTQSLHAQNTGLIGGYIKVEIQKADFTWQDVTAEILNYGISGPSENPGGADCLNGNPNAILQLQRVKNTAGFCGFSTTGTSQDSYDYWPNVLFDTREGVLRDVDPNTPRVTLAGLMHYVALDVGNLNKWLKGVAPYAGGSGVNALSTNGYGIYFSDRRNNRADGTNGTTLHGETGEYGFEDVVNPLSAIGTPNGSLDGGEDVNANGQVDLYGQYPSSVNAAGQARWNTLPAVAGLKSVNPLVAGQAGFDAITNIRPYLTLNPAQGIVNRTYLFRRALKLVNGGLASFATPGVTGLTVVTENPVYLEKDWNWNSTNPTGTSADGHAETSIIADAVTLLSNAWTDQNSFDNPYNAGARPRTASWYRVAIIGGKGMAFPWPSAGTPDTTFGTDGGAHNFLRYLETGAGTTNYRGAIATFYYSRQAVGTYKFNISGGTVYSAPTRAYAFDTDFLNPATLPPLTPVFRDINALGFAQEIRPGK